MSGLILSWCHNTCHSLPICPPITSCAREYWDLGQKTTQKRYINVKPLHLSYTTDKSDSLREKDWEEFLPMYMRDGSCGISVKKQLMNQRFYDSLLFSQFIRKGFLSMRIITKYFLRSLYLLPIPGCHISCTPLLYLLCIFLSYLAVVELLRYRTKKIEKSVHWWEKETRYIDGLGIRTGLGPSL